MYERWLPSTLVKYYVLYQECYRKMNQSFYKSLITLRHTLPKYTYDNIVLGAIVKILFKRASHVLATAHGRLDFSMTIWTF